MRVSDDPFTLWSISGCIGVAIRDLYDLVMAFFQHGHGKNMIWNIAADIFLKPAEIHSVWGNVLGLLADLVIGGILGAIIGLTIKLTGPKNYWLKGWAIGLVAWLLFFGVLLHNLPHIEKTAPEDAIANILAFIGHSIFGLITAWVYIRLAKSAARE